MQNSTETSKFGKEMVKFAKKGGGTHAELQHNFQPPTSEACFSVVFSLRRHKHIVYCYSYESFYQDGVQTLQTNTTVSTNPRKRVWRSHGVKVTLLEEKTFRPLGYD